MYVLANSGATCHMYRHSMFIRSKWIPTIPYNVIVIRMNENAWQYLNRGPYKVYPRWAQHILNKTYTSIAPRSDRIESHVVCCCWYLVYRDCLLSCPCVLVVHSLTRSLSFHCGQCVCWLVFTLQVAGALLTLLGCRLLVDIAFLRLFVYDSTHKHSDTLVLYFVFVYFCVVFVCFKYFILTLLWSNGPARRISRDVLLGSATSKF